ncbi:hypothetical protein EVG20_g8750 [Dentipellis fragilis]|uniref:Uncharacterized protein n=1 Tax=Dentipellis fragilis TaxID=205917 RepID=A0A4Y9Y5L4_9AGAM|nr:hypothetical protein EVG20_g8750 [Dentipellis fragilis]
MDKSQASSERDAKLTEPDFNRELTIDRDPPCRSDIRLGRAQISGYIRDFLCRCDFVYAGRSDFSELGSACIAKSIARGYITPENDSFRRLIPVGAAVVWNAYHHLPDEQTQEYLALLISFFVCAEDMFKDNNDAILAFNGLFIRRQPQRH